MHGKMIMFEIHGVNKMLLKLISPIYFSFLKTWLIRTYDDLSGLHSISGGQCGSE